MTLQSPPIAKLLPHSEAMALLDRLVSSDSCSLSAELAIREDGLFDDGFGFVPCYVGIEYMAQAIAAFAGMKARRRGEPVKLGFLLGTRNFCSSTANFPCGSVLTVSITEVLTGDNGMCAFDCEIIGEGILVTAQLKVYQPPNADDFLSGQR